jgi:hypothetical protein
MLIRLENAQVGDHACDKRRARPVLARHHRLKKSIEYESQPDLGSAAFLVRVMM